MVFNFGHTSSSISTAYQTEWLMQAVLPSHPNLNRFLGEFVSDVPDDMFAALSPLQQELGAWAWTVVVVCTLSVSPTGRSICHLAFPSLDISGRSSRGLR